MWNLERHARSHSYAQSEVHMRIVIAPMRGVNLRWSLNAVLKHCSTQIRALPFFAVSSLRFTTLLQCLVS
jgi:hypothetical protein